jgi:ssDNA-binding replication factor A large subunit
MGKSSIRNMIDVYKMSYDSDNTYETHDVKIESVKPLEKHIDVVFKAVEREEEREINSKSGETHRVCDFTVADETGSITLTLWNEDIEKSKKCINYLMDLLMFLEILYVCQRENLVH